MGGASKLGGKKWVCSRKIFMYGLPSFLLEIRLVKSGKIPTLLVGKLFTDKKVWTLNTDSKVGKNTDIFLESWFIAQVCILRGSAKPKENVLCKYELGEKWE